jgi:hypothetical protein
MGLFQWAFEGPSREKGLPRAFRWVVLPIHPAKRLILVLNSILFFKKSKNKNKNKNKNKSKSKNKNENKKQS